MRILKKQPSDLKMTIQTKTAQEKPPKSKENLKKNEETVFSILKSLTNREKELQEERDQLLETELSLKKLIKKEIENKKTKISDLETEIPELKQRIEILAQLLEIPVVK